MINASEALELKTQYRLKQIEPYLQKIEEEIRRSASEGCDLALCDVKDVSVGNFIAIIDYLKKSTTYEVSSILDIINTNYMSDIQIECANTITLRWGQE